MMGILQEMLADALYPTPEVLTGLLSLSVGITPMIILMAVTAINEISLLWFYWVMFGSKVLGLIVITFTKLEFNRTEVDTAGMNENQNTKL